MWSERPRLETGQDECTWLRPQAPGWYRSDHRGLAAKASGVTLTTSATVLFLHGGPGMTAQLERRQFGATLPVHWWDQPRVGQDTRRPYEMLVDAAAAEATRLCSNGYTGRVDLLANSSGAYLARALVDRIPERIGAITICGGVWDLSTALLRLGRYFARQCGDADLEAACCRAAEADIPEGYLALLAQVSTIPGFLDFYWSPSAGEPREAMKALAAEGQLIDWATCHAVMIAEIAAPQTPLAAPHPGGVRIVTGRFDPYFDDGDIEARKTLWPSAIVEIVDAGHFPHLELPPEVWMPRRTSDP